MRDLFLWYCGFGARSKAVFRLVVLRSPLIAHFIAVCLVSRLDIWLYDLGDGSLLGILLKLVFLMASSQLVILGFLVAPTTFVLTSALVTDPLGQATMAFSSTTMIILQLIELASRDGNFFCRPSIIAEYDRFNRRKFLRAAAEHGEHRRPRSMMTYTYQDLDERKKEIRLVRKVEGKSLSEEPCFELVNVSLDDDPTYHAISYVWGRPEHR